MTQTAWDKKLDQFTERCQNVRDAAEKEIRVLRDQKEKQVLQLQATVVQLEKDNATLQGEVNTHKATNIQQVVNRFYLFVG